VGYEHYCELTAEALEASRRKAREIVLGFKALLPYLPPLGGRSGRGKPLLSEEDGRLSFNGKRPEHYNPVVFPFEERDLIPPDGRYSTYLFRCKTMGFPYDLGVKAFLLLLKHHVGKGVHLFTDGSLGSWAPAAELLDGVLGVKVDLFEALPDAALWELSRL